MVDPTQAETDAPDRDSLAIVLEGGGARAAYQVGFLRCLVKHNPDFCPPIITGVSAGAINAAFLAARPGSLADAVEALTRLWSELSSTSFGWTPPLC